MRVRRGGGASMDQVVLEQVLDWDKALRRLAGDEGLLRELCDAFALDYPRKLTVLKAALGGRDSKMLCVTAHALKGACSVLCATRCVTLAGEVEVAAREKRWEELPALLRRLEREVQILLDTIASHGAPQTATHPS